MVDMFNYGREGCGVFGRPLLVERIAAPSDEQSATAILGGFDRTCPSEKLAACSVRGGGGP